MSLKELSQKLHPLERKVLPHLKNEMFFSDLVNSVDLKEIEIMRAIQWMENKDIVIVDSTEKEIIELDKNGLLYKKKGLPEKQFLNIIKDSKISMSELSLKLDKDEINICIGLLKRKNAIDIKKEKELIFSITKQGQEILNKKSDEEKFLELNFPIETKDLDKNNQVILKELLSRRQIVKKEKKIIRFIKLTKVGLELSKLKISDNVIDKLDSKMLKSESWKNKDFRRYDVEINVPSVSGGKRHFTLQSVDYIKSIWLELGFKEMTGNMVHTSFWDLDTLFVPQDHPAREMQDTFYLKNPKSGNLADRELVKKIKATHENGWTTGSKGWQTSWSEEKAKENILRTHTTVLSAETISKLKKFDLPAKFFSVGKVFRNEALDWKHLFEFYQVEGIVIDPDANFANLIGYLKDFFKKMGFPDVRIRPGHFPYTEPSAEVDVWHPIKKQWVEIGGSGIFRPEVTKPLMGFECPVLAWGLGMGRVITDYWKITDLRELYKNDLKQLKELKVWLK